MKLNLGCGYDRKEGYVNIDLYPADSVDMVLDLNRIPYPFEDSSIDEIFIQHTLEHLNDFEGTIKEFHRILKDEGRLTVIVPDFSSCYAFAPVHKIFFNIDSFNPFCDNLKDNCVKQPLFHMEERKLIFPHEIFPKPYKYFVLLYYLFPIAVYKIKPIVYAMFFSRIFPARDLMFKLKKKGS